MQYWGLSNYTIPKTEIERNLLEELNKIPDVHKIAQDKWKELGPFRLREYVSENKLNLDTSLPYNNMKEMSEFINDEIGNKTIIG